MNTKSMQPIMSVEERKQAIASQTPKHLPDEEILAASEKDRAALISRMQAVKVPVPLNEQERKTIERNALIRAAGGYVPRS